MAVIFIQNEERRNRQLQRYFIRDYANPFELPDVEFQRNYRINKVMALYLCNELEGSLTHIRRNSIPVHIRVLTAVNYMASGSYQRKIGQDQNLAIAQTTVSKYLGHVVKAINERLRSGWIAFPGTEEARRRVSAGWQRKSGLPDILGAIDCTHVTIFPPPRPTGLQYINRKGTHSINVQLIADADCRILHVNANYPGRVHDQFIFNHSQIKTNLKCLFVNRIGAYYLLGDSGYGLEPWMMTPVVHALVGSPEERYTQWQTQTRNVIERTNGYLKGSLRCLGVDQNLHYSPEKASSIIYACCTLYNIMKHFRVPLEFEDPNEEAEIQPEENPAFQPAQIHRLAIEKRQNLIATYFN